MTRLIPYANNLVVELFALGEISKGGLLIPQIAKASTPYRFGKVLEAGPGRHAVDGTLVPTSSKPGDIVAFAKNQGVPFPLDDDNGVEQEYLLISETYVMGRVEGMPEKSSLTGLDGQLLTMQPGSRARADEAYANLDLMSRARRGGIIDSTGGTLDAMDDDEEPS